MSVLSIRRALGRRRVRELCATQHVSGLCCPRCDDDSALSGVVQEGVVDVVRCANGCHARYSEHEYGEAMQAVADAAECERHDIEFGDE